jgi:hypothetical protein
MGGEAAYPGRQFSQVLMMTRLSVSVSLLPPVSQQQQAVSVPFHSPFDSSWSSSSMVEPLGDSGGDDGLMYIITGGGGVAGTASTGTARTGCKLQPLQEASMHSGRWMPIAVVCSSAPAYVG